MIDQDYFLITFDSIHAVMACEMFFKRKDILVKLIPLPSAVSSGCGFSLKILPEDVKEVVPFLRCSQLKELEGAMFYQMIKEQGQSRVKRWVF